LDVSNNHVLEFLNCNFNQLTAIDVSSNSVLEYLQCAGNFLSSIDTSFNEDLILFACEYNSITELDLSNNTNLTTLRCNDNLLTSLNVKNGNNTAITTDNFVVTNNPDLICITVDDVTYSNTNWTNKDPSASYSANCNLGAEDFEVFNSKAYPIPASDYVNISLKASAKYFVSNTLGQEVLNGYFVSGDNKLNVSTLD